MTNTPIHLPNLWKDDTRDLQLRAGCKDLRRRKCIRQANCEWEDGKCSRKAVGCRRISNEGKCTANRNCEWRDAKCRRIVTTITEVPGEGEDGGTALYLPKAAEDAIISKLSGGVPDLCFCKDTHEPCVSDTVTAINDWLHGGSNKCYQFKIGSFASFNYLAWSEWDHCVCKNFHGDILDFLATTITGYPEGGETCKGFGGNGNSGVILISN